MISMHQTHQTLDQITDLTERPRLGAIPVQGQILPPQRLHDEVADHSTVIGEHPRAILVENPGHTNLHRIHPLVVKAKGFGDAFALVVATANPDWIDCSVVALRLRINLRDPIHLTGAGQQQAGSEPPGQAEHVVGA